MNTKQKLALVTAVFFITTALGSLPLAAATQQGINPTPHTNTSLYDGNVTIYADGSLSVSSAPISHSGDYYNLTGDINGTLTILHNGTVFNGNGYNISYTPAHLSENMVLVNLTGTNNVTLSNVNLNSTHSFVGIYLYRSNHENLNDLNITSAGVSIMALNHTSDVNISGSTVTDSYSSSQVASIMLGVYPSGGSHPVASASAYGFHLYNDSLKSTGILSDVIIGGSGSSVTYSNFNDSHDYFSIMVGGNNSLVEHNNFNTSYSNSGSIAMGFAGSTTITHNLTFSHNSVKEYQSTVNTVTLNFVGTGTVTDNYISVYDTQYSAVGLNLEGGNTLVSGNSITMGNDNTSNSLDGIQSMGNNYSIAQNDLKMSGPSIGFTVHAPSSANVYNISIKNNFLEMYASNSFSAIGVTTTAALINSTISGNTMAGFGGSVYLISGEFQNSSIDNNILAIHDVSAYYGISLNSGDNNAISGNSITVSGPVITTASTFYPIDLADSGSLDMNNISVSGNTITDLQNATFGAGIYATFSGTQVYGLAITHNKLTMNGSISYVLLYDSNSQVIGPKITSNYLYGINGTNMFGLDLQDINFASV